MPRDHGTSSLNTQIASAVDLAISNFQKEEAQNINAAVANLASTSYINSAISSALGAYVTIASLASTLGLYVTTAALNAALGGYAKLVDLSNALAPYAQTSVVTSSIAAAVSPINSSITGLQNSISTANTNIGTNTSAISGLQTGLGNAVTNIGNLQTSTSSFQSSTSTTLSNLSSSVSTNSTNISSLQTSVTSLQTGLTAANTNITAVTNSVSALQPIVSTNSSNITALQSGLSSANNNISTNSSNITALQSGLATANSNITTANTNISSIQSALPTFATTSNVNSAITTLSNAVTSWLTGYLQLVGGTLTGPLNGTIATFNSIVLGVSSFVTNTGISTVNAVIGSAVFTKGLIFQNLSGGSAAYVTLKATTPGSGSYTVTLPDPGGGNVQLQYAGAAIDTGNNPINGGAGTFSGAVTANGGLGIAGALNMGNGPINMTSGGIINVGSAALSASGINAIANNSNAISTLTSGPSVSGSVANSISTSAKIGDTSTNAVIGNNTSIMSCANVTVGGQSLTSTGVSQISAHQSALAILNGLVSAVGSVLYNISSAVRIGDTSTNAVIGNSSSTVNANSLNASGASTLGPTTFISNAPYPGSNLLVGGGINSSPGGGNLVNGQTSSTSNTYQGSTDNAQFYPYTIFKLSVQAGGSLPSIGAIQIFYIQGGTGRNSTAAPNPGTAIVTAQDSNGNTLGSPVTLTVSTGQVVSGSPAVQSYYYTYTTPVTGATYLQFQFNYGSSSAVPPLLNQIVLYTPVSATFVNGALNTPGPVSASSFTSATGAYNSSTSSGLYLNGNRAGDGLVQLLNNGVPALTTYNGQSYTPNCTVDNGSGGASSKSYTSGSIASTGPLSAVGDFTLGGCRKSQGVSCIGVTPGWFLLGTLTMGMNGVTAQIQIQGGIGFNALDTQIATLTLTIRTSNATSTTGGGTAVSAIAYRTGGNGGKFAFTGVKLVQNAPGINATAYGVYINTGAYIGYASYSVQGESSSSWLYSGTTANDPGAASTTVYIVPMNLRILDPLYGAVATIDDTLGNSAFTSVTAGSGGFICSGTGNGFMTSNPGGISMDAAYGIIGFQNGAAATNGWGVRSGVNGYNGGNTVIFNVMNNGTVSGINNTWDSATGLAILKSLSLGSNTVTTPAGTFTFPSSSSTLAAVKPFLLSRINTSSAPAIVVVPVASNGITVAPAATNGSYITNIVLPAGNFDLIVSITLSNSNPGNVTLSTDANSTMYPGTNGTSYTLYTSNGLASMPYPIPTVSFTIIATASSTLTLNFSSVVNVTGSLKIRAF